VVQGDGAGSLGLTVDPGSISWSPNGEICRLFLRTQIKTLTHGVF